MSAVQKYEKQGVVLFLRCLQSAISSERGMTAICVDFALCDFDAGFQNHHIIRIFIYGGLCKQLSLFDNQGIPGNFGLKG